MLASTTRPLALAALVALAACQPIASGPYAEPSCEETVTMLASVDEQAPSGLSAAAFVDLIAGERVTTLEYLGPPAEGVFVEIEHGDATSTQLSLELTPELPNLRWVEAEIVYPEGSSMDAEIQCEDRFEFEGTLSVTTADGVLAELFETTISAIVDDDGALSYVGVPIAFDPDDLMGSFEVISVEPSSPGPSHVLHELWVEYPLDPGLGAVGQPRGYVGGVAEYNYIDYIAIGAFHIGVFGGYDLGS